MWYKFIIKNFVRKIRIEEQPAAEKFIDKICDTMFKVYYENHLSEIVIPLGVINKLNKNYRLQKDGSIILANFKEFLFFTTLIYIKYANDISYHNKDFLQFCDFVDEITPRANKEKDYLIERERGSGRWFDKYIKAFRPSSTVDVKIINKAEIALLRRFKYRLVTKFEDVTVVFK